MANFNPSYTPIEMFKMGIFGGNYFKVHTELPQEFLDECEKENIILFENKTNYNKNHFYKKECGKDYSWWIEKKLIHKQDPNGWVEWYVKYYYGRRTNDDTRQINRFNAFVARHKGLYDYHKNKGIESEKTKQNLLQWGYDYRNSIN